MQPHFVLAPDNYVSLFHVSRPTHARAGLKAKRGMTGVCSLVQEITPLHVNTRPRQDSLPGDPDKTWIQNGIKYTWSSRKWSSLSHVHVRGTLQLLSKTTRPTTASNVSEGQQAYVPRIHHQMPRAIYIAHVCSAFLKSAVIPSERFAQARPTMPGIALVCKTYAATANSYQVSARSLNAEHEVPKFVLFIVRRWVYWNKTGGLLFFFFFFFFLIGNLREHEF